MKKVLAVEFSGMRPWPGRLIIVLFLLMSANASAAELTLRIFERGGKAPLEDVAVCLGTPARLTQFGAGFTDDEGYVVFPDVPRTQLLVTVSRPGYMGEQERMAVSGENRMLVLSLSTGGGGVQCLPDQDVMVKRTGSLEIKSFLLNNGAAVTANTQVTLDNKIRGDATQYRVSERPDFYDAEWLAYEDRPYFHLSAGPGNKTVYFQVRRHALINGAGIEARSSVMHDSIYVQF